MRYAIIIVLYIQISFGFNFLLSIGFLFVQSVGKMSKKSPQVNKIVFFLTLFCFVFNLRKKKIYLFSLLH